MQKLLISSCCLFFLQMTACSSGEEKSDNAPTNSFLERIPIVYRQDIQQGNIITQEMVNKLEPGMTKRQVRFVLGTPMLVDAFHLNRWDYQYANTEGWGETERKRLTLYFQNDRLMRLEGDYRPSAQAQDGAATKETVVSVPDYEDPDKGIITQAVEAVENVWKDDPAVDASPGQQAIEKAAAAEQQRREDTEQSDPPRPEEEMPAGPAVE